MRNPLFFALVLLASCQSETLLPIPKDPCTQFQGTQRGAPYHIFIGKSLDPKRIAKAKAAIEKTFAEVDSLFKGPLTDLDEEILKGICIDWLVERLQKLGTTDLFVEWDGKMRASGQHPVIGSWPVQINPHLRAQGQPLSPIHLSNKAIASRADHSFEPAAHSIAFATVIAPSSALAEALASCAMLFPSRKEAENWAQEVVKLYPDISFWILSQGKE